MQSLTMNFDDAICFNQLIFPVVFEVPVTRTEVRGFIPMFSFLLFASSVPRFCVFSDRTSIKKGVLQELGLARWGSSSAFSVLCLCFSIPPSYVIDERFCFAAVEPCNTS